MLAVLMTISTLVTAGATVFIALYARSTLKLGKAIQHFSTQHQQEHARLEVYNRRFEVFHALTHFIAYILRGEEVIQEDSFQHELNRFNAAISESVFLFDKQISEYLETVYKKAVLLPALGVAIGDLPVGEARTHQLNKLAELREWFRRQQEVSRKKFRKYLEFQV